MDGQIFWINTENASNEATYFDVLYMQYIYRDKRFYIGKEVLSQKKPYL